MAVEIEYAYYCDHYCAMNYRELLLPHKTIIMRLHYDHDYYTNSLTVNNYRLTYFAT